MDVTKSAIVDGLRRLGLARGDILLVHSSMKSLGHVDGGPEAVVDAFLEVLGPEGLLIVPTLSGGCFINRETGQARAAFDPAVTPSRVGLITNTVRSRPNAHRSRHPSHSIAAIGARAAELVADGREPFRTFDRTGPYGRYVRWGARILFLGCKMAANTTFHAVEDWLELPYIVKCRGRALVHRPGDGNVAVDVTMCPGGHRDFYYKTHRTKIEEVLFGAGAVTEGQVGQAHCLLIGALDCVNLTARRMETDPGVLLCDGPDCEFCATGQRECRQALPEIRARALGLIRDLESEVLSLKSGI